VRQSKLNGDGKARRCCSSVSTTCDSIDLDTSPPRPRRRSQLRQAVRLRVGLAYQTLRTTSHAPECFVSRRGSGCVGKMIRHYGFKFHEDQARSTGSSRRRGLHQCDRPPRSENQVDQTVGNGAGPPEGIACLETAQGDRASSPTTHHPLRTKGSSNQGRTDVMNQLEIGACRPKTQPARWHTALAGAARFLGAFPVQGCDEQEM